MRMTDKERLALIGGARRQLESLRLPDTALKICAAGLARLEGILAQPPRVRILGEVNSGKTSVADVLLGVGLLPASVVANTRLPVLIKYAETTALHVIGPGGRRQLTEKDLDDLPNGVYFDSLEIGLPSERLEEFEILDAPALTELGTEDAEADIFVWCTVATRAWTETERALWSTLPRRCWRNALLVATHKDAIADQDDLLKVERRLRTVTSGMFRDVMLVAAADSGRSRSLQLDGLPKDASAAALLASVRIWAAEIRERRALKAERIICRLARLTFHQLARAALKSEEATVLKSWESDCAKLLESLNKSPDLLAAVIRNLLIRYAQALEWTRPGGIRRHSGSLPLAPTGDTPASWPRRGPAARRFARLIAEDLTALLRIELARTGLREPAPFADYAKARAILLPLANLDAVFDDLGQLFAAGNAKVEAPDAQQVRV